MSKSRPQAFAQVQNQILKRHNNTNKVNEELMKPYFMKTTFALKHLCKTFVFSLIYILANIILNISCASFKQHRPVCR